MRSLLGANRAVFVSMMVIYLPSVCLYGSLSWLRCSTYWVWNHAFLRLNSLIYEWKIMTEWLKKIVTEPGLSFWALDLETLWRSLCVSSVTRLYHPREDSKNLPYTTDDVFMVAQGKRITFMGYHVSEFIVFSRTYSLRRMYPCLFLKTCILIFYCYIINQHRLSSVRKHHLLYHSVRRSEVWAW